MLNCICPNLIPRTSMNGLFLFKKPNSFSIAFLAAGEPPPGYQPYSGPAPPPQWQNYGATAVTVQPAVIYAVGACPACRVRVKSSYFPFIIHPLDNLPKAFFSFGLCPPPLVFLCNCSCSYLIYGVGAVFIRYFCGFFQIGILEDDYTCLGIFCAIFFFPLGIIACLLLKNRRCSNCGAYFG